MWILGINGLTNVKKITQKHLLSKDVCLTEVYQLCSNEKRNELSEEGIRPRYLLKPLTPKSDW